MLNTAIPTDAPATDSRHGHKTQCKAVALISGGLDSLLAARVVIEQGIHVEGLNFFTGFCVEGHTHAIRSKDRERPKRNNALWVAEQLGIRLHFVDVVEEYKRVVINPQTRIRRQPQSLPGLQVLHGRQGLSNGYRNTDSTSSSPVRLMGQRPMSQRKDTMPVIATRVGRR